MTPCEMCSSCTHSGYCMAAYEKDHWCGNYTRKERKYEVSDMRKTDRAVACSVEERQQDNDMR